MKYPQIVKCRLKIKILPRFLKIWISISIGSSLPWYKVHVIMANAYLIIVISLTLAGFFNPNILHPKITKNTHKLHEIAPKSVTYAVFRFESGNFYTGQNFFTQAPPVVPVTNMRYAKHFFNISFSCMCKKNLSGAKFSRLKAKKCIFYTFWGYLF